MHQPTCHEAPTRAARACVQAAASCIAALALPACFMFPKPEQPPPPAPAPAAPAAAASQVPTGQLPRDVLPLAYTLELSIVPSAPSFSGRARIAVQVTQPTQRIWLHGDDLQVSAASVTSAAGTLPASYTQMNEAGVVALALGQPVPAGQALIDISYTAKLDEHLKGLYKVEVEGEHYAFTQFEPYSARLAFPGFDEPAFKTPFDLWITARADDTVIANTPKLTSEPLEGGFKRVHFAPTKPLPTYLIGLSVGPLEVVEAEPIAPNEVRSTPLPFRGVAVKGRGAQLRYALKHTGALVQSLERYFGSPYPYAKLDVIAVPDFAAGAMENAGAITFREWLLLLDDSAGQYQRRAFASVMAHELAHHWVGDLVTMPWWNDIWLNEAFATWLSMRVLREVYPDYREELDFLGGIHGAMAEDSRKSARMIRQPITSTHDITNAFDGITYQKGGGVIAMFERYLGEDTFQKGIRAYLAARPYGSGTSDELLAALSAASEQDVAAPFSSFLEQVGVPLVEASAECEGSTAALSLKQSRYLPLGSSASRDGRWQIPVCARYASGGGAKETCMLLTEPETRVPLDGGCPDWLMPNAGAAGYYRFALPDEQLSKLVGRGWSALTAMEKLALADSLEAGLESGTLEPAAVLDAYARMAGDPEREVATAPIHLLAFAEEHLVEDASRPALQARVRAWYAPVLKRVGWKPKRGESGQTSLLRADVLSALADIAHDAPVRQKLARLGLRYLGYGGDGAIHEDAVPADVRDLAVRIAVEDGDAALYDAVEKRALAAGEPGLRGRLISALSSVRDARSQRALALVLDPGLRVNEVLRPLNRQMDDRRTREAAWKWLQDNFEAVSARVPADRVAGLAWTATYFCNEEGAKRAEALLGKRIESLPGGPRSLAGALEALQLCSARVKAHRDKTVAYFTE